MRTTSLSREILRTMTAIAFGVTLLVVFTTYVFFYVALTYWPDYFAEPSMLPSPPEWVGLILTTLTALGVAALVAVRLSRRILAPLNSVADAIRRVAAGELEARAQPGDRSLGEAARLADDFNALAGQLQRVTQEQMFWNAAIAHELRTPVTVLRGRLQGLAEGVFAPSEPQFRSLLAQVEGLGRLVEDLRVVGLADSGHLDLQWCDADLAHEAAVVVQPFEDLARAAGQRVVLAVPSCQVRCDPLRIRQALLALLDNARRHAVPGEVRVGGAAGDGWFSLWVEDDGPGVPTDLADELFTAFRRAGAERRGGSGLGLAVVAAIARAHGGEARCLAAGGGTRFVLRWPLAQASARQKPVG